MQPKGKESLEKINNVTAQVMLINNDYQHLNLITSEVQIHMAFMR